MTTVGTTPPPETLATRPGLGRDPGGPLLGAPVGVILAAGSSSRLGGVPKALVHVAGVTLLERAVTTFRECGVDRIIVVVGHAGEEVREFVVRRGLDVDIVANDEFGLGNGSSFLVGGRAADGRFLVGMVDHVVDAEAVARLLASRAAFALAVDTRPLHCDLDEATKVRLEGGRVVAVTRELEDYDAVDAGLAVCDPSVLSAAERSLLAGGGTWNAIKRHWIEEGREIEAIDLDGLFWIDVDTPRDVRRAERLIVARAARKAWDGPVARHVNRRVSWPLSLLLLRRGVSPTAATVVSLALALVAAGTLAAGHEWTLALVLGGVLAQLASILDGIDGEIARASLRTSPAGAFADSVLDRVADAALLVGLAVAAGLDSATGIALGLAMFGTLQVPYVRASYEASFGRPFPPSAYRLGFGRDVRLLVLAASACALQPFAGLVAVAALTGFEVVHRLVRALRTPA